MKEFEVTYYISDEDTGYLFVKKFFGSEISNIHYQVVRELTDNKGVWREVPDMHMLLFIPERRIDSITIKEIE